MPRLLLFSDLHCDVAAARRLLERARRGGFDVLVGAGDFGNLRRHVGDCVAILAQSGLPAVFVAGNNESTDELTAACRAWKMCHVLHGGTAVVAGVTFFGLGGGIPETPFGAWSYDLGEDDAADLLKACPPGCVLVTHSPPKGVLDRSSRGASLGSVAIRDAILRWKPVLAVCGHIHACGGRSEPLGDTTVINAGPEGIEWDLADGGASAGGAS